MGWILSLCLLTSIVFLTGCDDRAVPDDMTWVQPIEFSKETKEWLGSLEWPQAAYADFDKIRKHNEKLRRIRSGESIK